MDSTAEATQYLTPTDQDKAGVLARYKQVRSRGTLTPHSAMQAVAYGYARSYVLVEAAGMPGDKRLLRLWAAADTYCASMFDRPRYWMTSRRAPR